MAPSNAALLKERRTAEPHLGDMAAMLDLVAIDKALVAKGGLREFSQLAWEQIHPGVPLNWGWVHDAVSEFLAAFVRGEIKKGIINIPPRMAKSTLASVCAPVYSWIDNSYLRWLTSSYRDNLATRDSVRSRRLITTPWFQKRWGSSFNLTSDQNQKTFYENNNGGYRMSQSVVGGSTGEGGNRIIVDDPHNVKRAESDVERENALIWWDEEMTSRLDDQRKDGRLIIMQRLHERDLSGHCLEKGGYEHLCLPMEYESERCCSVSLIGFTDPRTEEGELLEPERFPAQVVEDMTNDLGAYAASGQLQQRPAPREGGMFETDKIEVVEAIPASLEVVTRYWDKAGTDKRVAKGRGAFTAGVKLARIKHGIYKGKWIILDVIREQWAATQREIVIKNTAISDGKDVHIFVEQEPGSGGKESVESTISNLAGYNAEPDRPTGDKTLRAEPLSKQVNIGNVIMLKAPWNVVFIGELNVFPVGGKKDQVDAAAGAFNKAATVRTGGYTW